MTSDTRTPPHTGVATAFTPPAPTDILSSDDRYRSVVDNSPLGIYRVDRAGRFLAVNRALCAIVGYEADELTSMNIAAIYADPAERPRRVVEFEQRPRGTPIDLSWRRRDGEVFIARVWVYAARDAQGRIEFFDGHVEDVTGIRATEQALRQSEKLAALGQLVSGVAHELNNPLSAILLFAEDLLMLEQRAPEETDALQIIVQQARRSRSIVRDLLAFVRRGELQRTRLPADEFITDLARALKPQVAVLGVTLHVGDTQTAILHADRAGIEQVISNLIINGAQAAGAGGNVWLSTRADLRDYVIEVRDDGPGIPADALPRIFEPFFTTKPMGQGTGLGLSVSLGVVQQHGGSIIAENGGSAPGGGAVFTVRLPFPTEVFADSHDAAS